MHSQDSILLHECSCRKLRKIVKSTISLNTCLARHVLLAKDVLSLFYLTHLKQKPEKVKNEGILYKMQMSFMGCNTMNEN